MTIRRAKKLKYIVNDTRIKTCLRRFDDNVYTRLEFLKAVSHSMGAHSCDLYAEPTDSDGDSPTMIKKTLMLWLTPAPRPSTRLLRLPMRRTTVS